MSIDLKNIKTASPKGSARGLFRDSSNIHTLRKSMDSFDVFSGLEQGRLWIEAVTGETFESDDFVIATRDGVLLCR